MDASTLDRKLTELAGRLAASLPEGLGALRRDAEQNFKALLQGAVSKLDLISRREFDVQAGVLQRTREKLAALEQRVQELEQREHKSRSS